MHCRNPQERILAKVLFFRDSRRLPRRTIIKLVSQNQESSINNLYNKHNELINVPNPYASNETPPLL
jgi:hypothetical protein